MAPAKRTVIAWYALPEAFAGPLSHPDDADEQLAALKKRCGKVIKQHAAHILTKHEIPEQAWYGGSGDEELWAPDALADEQEAGQPADAGKGLAQQAETAMKAAEERED